MTSKKDREEIMSDEERIAALQKRNVRCTYCRGSNPVQTITDRLFACCFKCAEWDNNAKVLRTSLPCICCGKLIEQSLSDEPFTVNNVANTPFSGGMADRIDCGYGSRFDTNVYMIAVCDDCIEQKTKEGKLTFVYSYMPNGDGSPTEC